MNLYFVRHGQTDWNLEKKIQGSYDTELNNTGLKQAENLSFILNTDEYNFNSIYSSIQKRAVQTAEIISINTETELNIVNGLEEICLGSWESMTWEQVENEYSVEYREWFSNRRYYTPPCGESYQDMLIRVFKCINEIVSNNIEDDILIVTHSAIIMCIQCLLTDTPFEEMTIFSPKNGSVLKINTDDLFANSFKL